MSFGQARRALGQLNDWTWLVAQYRGWLITLATVIGGAAPLISAARKHLPQPSPSLVVRSGAMALALSAAAVAICSLLHFTRVSHSCFRVRLRRSRSMAHRQE